MLSVCKEGTKVALVSYVWVRDASVAGEVLEVSGVVGWW
jgi:hypothetical protein